MLAQSHALCFLYLSLWQLSRYDGRLEWLQETTWPHMGNPYCAALYRKFAHLFLKYLRSPRLKSDLIRTIHNKLRPGCHPDTHCPLPRTPAWVWRTVAGWAGPRVPKWCNGATCCECLQALLPGKMALPAGDTPSQPRGPAQAQNHSASQPGSRPFPPCFIKTQS